MSEHTRTAISARPVPATTEWPSVEARCQHTHDPEGDDDYGHRPLSNWGSGDLPAPYAVGDLLWLPKPYNGTRMRPEMGDPGWYVVVSAYSIDEGDAWYFRVERLGDVLTCSGRLHVIFADRAEIGSDVDQDWMAPFELVETADPDGLAERERLLAGGWAYEAPPRCPTCDHRLPVTATRERPPSLSENGSSPERQP